MFRQSKTNIALCGFLMVIVGFGFQAVGADDDKEAMIQLERIAMQSAQQTTQQSAQPQSNHDTSFLLEVLNAPGGITYYDDKLLVVDEFSPRVFAYNPDGTYDADASFSLISENDNAQGITNGDGKFWVANWNYDVDVMRDVGDSKILAYNLDGTYDRNASFSLISANDTPSGITYYDDKLWVTDPIVSRVFAYNPDGTYDADASFYLTTENDWPNGITYGDGKFWVVELDLFDFSVGMYAYNPDGTYDRNASFDLTLFGNDYPTGITYYDGKLWVTDFFAGAVYIYSVQESETDPDASLESRITNLETEIADLKTLLIEIIKRLEALETGTPAPEPVITTGISGTVYTDSNNNDILDAGESGVSNRSVIAVKLSDQTDISRDTTDANGDYSFDLEAGGYLVQVEGTDAFAYVTILDGSILTQNLGI